MRVCAGKLKHATMERSMRRVNVCRVCGGTSESRLREEEELRELDREVWMFLPGKIEAAFLT